MADSLSGRSALVTGGGSGIGRAVALMYQSERVRVTVLDRRLPTGLPAGVTVVAGDVTDPGDVARAVAAAAPDGALDLLTTCAGVFDYYAQVTAMTAAELTRSFREIFDVNVLGSLLAVREAAPALRAAGGAVTLTLSTAAFYPGGGGPLYAASKAALRGMVSHLAAELAPGVRVNGVAPGGTGGTRLGGLAALDQAQTADQVPGRDERIRDATLLGVLPMPEDHTAAYRYLATSRVVTGTVVISDAGRG